MPILKRGNCSLILYLVIDWFNKNSPPFCPEDVSKLSNLVKSCVLAFFFICFVLVFNDYSPMHLYSDAGGSNKANLTMKRAQLGGEDNATLYLKKWSDLIAGTWVWVPETGFKRAKR